MLRNKELQHFYNVSLPLPKSIQPVHPELSGAQRIALLSREIGV